MQNPSNWRPSAELRTLRARARLYAAVREFFERRGVLEVDTPALSAAATVDPNIESFAVAPGRWLQTSPEFAMKRLLAAGSGPIYQIAHAFRLEEAGRHHNPEFSLLEWYRPGFDPAALMQEVEDLLKALGVAAQMPWPRLSYQQAFGTYAGLDPLAAGIDELRACCRRLLPGAALDAAEPRDTCLDLLMGHVVGPRLGVSAPAFVYDFPASQAALARLRPDAPVVAERFELFWQGLELANGFHELADAAEQGRRFERDLQQRAGAGRVQPPRDEHLLAALAAGLPDCSGVALGLDRLLMLMLGLPRLGEVVAFEWSRA